MSRPAQARAEDSGDVDIVRRLRTGDRAAVDALYERFSRPAFALARRILADDALAEDVLREVFLGVWRDPGAFDRGRGSFASWLLALVHHRAVDAVRREETQQRREHRLHDEPALAAPATAPDVAASGALAALPSLQREALTLAYYGGYTQREVAALTGAPLGTVKTRMLAGIRRLRAGRGSATGGTAFGGALGGTAPVDGANR